MSKPEHVPQSPASDEDLTRDDLALVEIAQRLARQALESEYQAAELRVKAAEII
jgi:hypothetical protein